MMQSNVKVISFISSYVYWTNEQKDMSRKLINIAS
jgi:hypothetical protein